MILFSLSIFLSAFLLFQIQPMIGRFILPWFGGTPAVWSTAMLFFQSLLTGGYAYAYWLVKQRRQGLFHLILLGMTLALLSALGLVWSSPITPSLNLRPADVSSPVLDIFVLLTISVGLPYFVLAANGPLMQAWFSRIFPEKSYARLYALSNVGSLLGLLAYPILVEPSLTLREQAWMWAGGFALFAIFAGALSHRARRGQGSDALAQTEKPSGALRSLWIVLSGIASLFLLSATNQISQEVAVIPFLWIAPLSVYLLSFILAFSSSRWYDRRVYTLLFSLASLAVLAVMLNTATLNVLLQIAAYNTLLFLACMICHGELYQLRPEAEHLTGFYLMVSLGGAAGGLFVNLAAPFLFTGYWEFYLAWLLTIVLLVVMLLPKFNLRVDLQSRSMSLAFLAGTVLLALGLNPNQDSFFAARNFYGVIRVRAWKNDAYSMIHGMTVHGIQFSKDRARPTTYFTEESGVGLVLSHHPGRGGLRVGILGLGAGTIAVYGTEGDSYRFYEINPVVIELAKGRGGYFSFLANSQADVTVIEGDARISLEKELAKGEGNRFDVLVLDTFSSDSIPVHLVTKEAFDLYLRHLAPNGIIAAHISNRHLDLQPVLRQMAMEYGLNIARISAPPDAEMGVFPSEWILLTYDAGVFETPAIAARAILYDDSPPDIRLWTDDYSNLFQILK